MRKHRAWDGKRMIPVAIDSEGTPVFLGIDGRWNYIEPEPPVMDYIGLKNKTGVDLCEGDVVRRRDRVWTVDYDQREVDGGKRIPIKDRKYGEATGRIVWDNEFAAFEVDLIKGEKWSFYSPDGATFAFEELEVIGNIYESDFKEFKCRKE